MATHTIRRLHRDETPHTDWCARDHRCGTTEHRSAGKVTVRGTGRAVLTRVRAADVEYAEVVIRIPLSGRPAVARTQLGTLLRLLGDLLDAITARPSPVPAPAGRPAIDRRSV